MTVSDPLHHASRPDEHWTTANLGEAMPGVATPLSATVWGDAVDKGLMAGAVALGAVAPREAQELGPPAQRLTALFHGRAAVKADVLGLIGDRMPGTTGAEVVHDLFGEVPGTMAFAPTKRRYPVVAVRLPHTFVTWPTKVRALAAEYDAWWAASVAALDTGAAATPGAAATSGRPAEPTVLLREAAARLERAVIVQSVAVMTCVQPVYEALAQLVRDAGAGDLSVLSAPPGGAERAVVADLWAASRRRLSVADVVARHGFHGPFEGELSSRVWREDPTVLEAIVERYAQRDESPEEREADLARTYAHEETALLAAVGAARRPAARAVLRLVRARIPLRGVAKRSMLQSLDVARAAARRIDAPGDVFYLTLDEALALPADAADHIAERQAQRAAHAAVTIPEAWRGAPPTVPATPHAVAPDRGATPGPATTPSAAASGAATPGVATPTRATADLVTGAGVSRGVVEGLARVVDDPTFAEVEDDEILVAPTTDPSWAAIMFVSAALVVDIGGALSHAAVVARELGIPCVVNTRDGTRRITTGDRVRVDGTAGTVEILERA